MASRPTQPEDTSEYIAWARNQELQMDCYSVSYSNEKIEHNVAEILSLLRNYSAILGMIRVKLKLIHDRRNRGRKHFPDVLYLSNDLTVCENVDDFADSNYDSDESRLVWHTLDTATLFDVSDELRMFPIFKENGFYPVPRNWDQTIDFETLMGEAFTLIDEELLPLLIAVKNQLVSIQHCLGEIEEWIIEPSKYIRRIFGDDLHCLQLSYMANHCDQEVPFVLGKKPVRIMTGWNNGFDISSDERAEYFQRIWNAL